MRTRRSRRNADQPLEIPVIGKITPPILGAAAGVVLLVLIIVLAVALGRRKPSTPAAVVPPTLSQEERIATVQAMLKPTDTPTPTPMAGFCVVAIQDGDTLASALEQFGVEYKNKGTYFTFGHCGPAGNSWKCDTRTEIKVHNAVDVGQWIEIPQDAGLDQDACIADKGKWVQ